MKNGGKNKSVAFIILTSVFKNKQELSNFWAISYHFVHIVNI